MDRMIRVSLSMVSVVMILLGAILLALSIGAPIPLNFGITLRIVGCVLVLAVLAEIILGKVWGRWEFALSFAYFAYRILTSDSSLTNYPQDLERQFGLAVIPVLLSFGGIHLIYRLK